MNNTLHLITDPLCGWCFGAIPMINACQKIPNLNLKLHFGGLFSTPNDQTVEQNMRDFIFNHHVHITKLSGQTPSMAFTELLDSNTAVLDSTPPIQAILAVELAEEDKLRYYKAIINAHFMEGRRVVEKEILREIATECGIPAVAFDEAFDKLSGFDVAQHINASRIFMQEVNGNGFPTFALEQDGEIQKLNHQSLYKDPEGWQQLIEELMSAQVTH